MFFFILIPVPLQSAQGQYRLSGVILRRTVTLIIKVDYAAMFLWGSVRFITGAVVVVLYTAPL
ncbi:MAG: hypothetical protein AUK35_11100 [Zetaproteobacteria bacterium CG2_30_46_52]|nr:MAG: hypothetical protein AUK35_11100 [Zetaproteobacteria bacterium CG2_30_46_52]